VRDLRRGSKAKTVISAALRHPHPHTDQVEISGVAHWRGDHIDIERLVGGDIEAGQDVAAYGPNISVSVQLERIEHIRCRGEAIALTRILIAAAGAVLDPQRRTGAVRKGIVRRRQAACDDRVNIAIDEVGVGAAAIDDEVRDNRRCATGIRGPDDCHAVDIEMRTIDRSAGRDLRQAESGAQKGRAHPHPGGKFE